MGFNSGFKGLKEKEYSAGKEEEGRVIVA